MVLKLHLTRFAHTQHIVVLALSRLQCLSSSSLFEGYPLQVRHKLDWDRGFILLLPQAPVLPESDAGSDVIKPASSFVIKNRQTSCSMWCPMYWHVIKTMSSVFSEAPHSQFGEGARPHLCMDEWNRICA